MADVIAQPTVELEEDTVPGARSLHFDKNGAGAVFCVISVKIKGESLPRHAKFPISDVAGQGTTKTLGQHLLACFNHGLTVLGVTQV